MVISQQAYLQPFGEAILSPTSHGSSSLSPSLWPWSPLSQDYLPIVKLSLDSTWSLRENGFNLWHPFAFIPTAIPGFTDYYSTYSHFRIVKAVLQISRQLQGVSNNGLLNHYLIVGSRPFVASTAPARLDVNTSVEYLALAWRSRDSVRLDGSVASILRRTLAVSGLASSPTP